MRSNFWRSLRFSAVASSLILAAWLTPASADVIYNGGAPDQGGQIYSEAPGVVAMSFELTSGETDITGVNWWGGCYPSATSTCGNTSPTFLVDIWSDNGGTPDMVLDSDIVFDANQSATGNLISGPGGWDEYSYSAAIQEVTNLSAGTTYFLSIQETAGEPSGLWGWETTSSAPPGAFLESYDPSEGTWSGLPEQLAFNLTGPPAAVPEPTSLPLLCTGILFSIALWQRSRRSRATGGRSK
ncbi:MAG TPA: PEP-CTERM sorting domain-containing protein [Bryobacteraceae bacterium]|nr:PEP-CTERM sorting domain-containing protein [Bryobacteraceae bacterium]